MTAARDDLAGLMRLPLTVIDDDRGGLDKIFDPAVAAAIGRRLAWRQVLRSRTRSRGVLRGLHAQVAPASEAKLLLPLKGRMFWVCVDLRRDSASFGQWRSQVLDARTPVALFAERGFGHGCLSLSDDVELLILADNDYRPDCGVGIAWNDGELAISWPLDGATPALSAEHAAFASFADFRRQHGGL